MTPQWDGPVVHVAVQSANRIALESASIQGLHMDCQEKETLKMDTTV
jgi:hypothetical protein